MYIELAQCNSDIINLKKVQKLGIEISIIIIFGQRLTSLIA